MFILLHTRHGWSQEIKMRMPNNQTHFLTNKINKSTQRFAWDNVRFCFVYYFFLSLVLSMAWHIWISIGKSFNVMHKIISHRLVDFFQHLVRHFIVKYNTFYQTLPSLLCAFVCWFFHQSNIHDYGWYVRSCGILIS